MRLSIVCMVLAAVGAAHAKVKLPEWERLPLRDVPRKVLDAVEAEKGEGATFDKGKVGRGPEVVRVRFRRDGKSVELLVSKEGQVLSRRVDGAEAKAPAEPVKTEPVKADPAPTGAVSFMRDIAPVLQKSCVECHSARKRKADYDVSTHAAALEGVVPGKPESSDLYMSLLGKGRKKMPPKGPLPAAQIEMVRKWIADGAKND